MGADLITFILIGPKNLKLSAARRESVVRRVMGKRKAALEEAWQGMVELRKVSLPRPQTGISAADELEEFLRDEGEGRECLVHLSPEEVCKTLDKLAALWNDGYARDLNCRLWKDGRKIRRLVVAGEMSYGDEPGGYAFQLLKEAQATGLLDVLGIE